MRTFRSLFLSAVVAGAGVCLPFLPSVACADGGRLFVTSAVENADGTVTLPLYRGTSQGRTVW